jgi:hypothetical protein
VASEEWRESRGQWLVASVASESEDREQVEIGKRQIEAKWLGC